MGTANPRAGTAGVEEADSPGGAQSPQNFGHGIEASGDRANDPHLSCGVQKGPSLQGGPRTQPCKRVPSAQLPPPSGSSQPTLGLAGCPPVCLSRCLSLPLPPPSLQSAPSAQVAGVSLALRCSAGSSARAPVPPANLGLHLSPASELAGG
jgi:hypothetical protein